jgi:hypothetical protein
MSNCGHGHVIPNANGSKARCGGPAICSKCALDLARLNNSAQPGTSPMSEQSKDGGPALSVSFAGHNTGVVSHEVDSKDGWQDIATEPVPNNVFDVLAKYYDAGLDQFLIARLTGCVQVEGRILWQEPFPTIPNPGRVDIVAAGYRPVMWAHIPDMPKGD